MPEPTKEELYDLHIAPMLKEVGKKCHKLGLPFVAAVEYAPYSIAGTSNIPTDSGVAILMARMAAMSAGHADRLIMSMIQYAQLHGHQSVYLKILGVPEGDPKDAPPSASAITVTQSPVTEG